MGDFKEFIKAVPKSLYPDAYKKLADEKFHTAIKYVPLLLLFSLIIMCLAYIPVFMLMPGQLGDEISKFTTLNIKITEDMKEPIVFPKEEPFIIVDTTGKYTELGKESVLVTDKVIQYRPGISTQTIQVSEDVNALDYKDNMIELIVFILIMIVPSLLILLYLSFLIKYIVLIAVAWFVGYLISKIAKSAITFMQMLKVCIFATTLMILVEVISKPFGITKWLVKIPLPFGMSLMVVPITLFVIYVIIGAAIVGQKEISYKKKD